MSRIEQLISEIEEYIDSCKFQALSNSKIIVNKEEMEELLVELRMRIPDEIKKYQKIISQQETILSDAQAQSESMLADAKKQSDSMIAQATEQANTMVEQATEQANSMVAQADAQTNEMVNDHEIMQRAYAHANEVVEQANVQAQAIVDMRLRALTGLEREKIEAEYAELMKKIEEFKAILADKKLLLGVIKKEILVISEKYGDDRRTRIGYDEFDISMEDLIPRENVVITMTKLGYIKRMTMDTFKSQNRGGKGIKGMQTLEDDYIRELFVTTSHHYIMFFTNTGRVYRMKAYEIPEAGRTARGTAIINLLQLMPEEKITAIIPLREYEEGKYLFMATEKGLVKKTPIQDYANVRKTGLAAIALREDDRLIEVKVTDNTEDILLVTRDGMCIRFNETDVRSTGRVSMGVRGMNLTDNDVVIGMQTASQGTDLLIVSEKGMGKRTNMDEFTRQNRGGKGVKCYKITEKTGNVVGMKAVDEDSEIMIINTEGIIIRMKCSDISVYGRITSGVKLINLKEKDKVASVAKVRKASAEIDGEQVEISDGEEPESEASDNSEES